MEQSAGGQPQPQEGPQLSELLPGLSTAVAALARTAKRVPEPSDIYYYRNIREYSQASRDICSQAQALLAAAATHLTRPTPAAATAAARGSRSASVAAAAAAQAAASDADSDDDEDANFSRLTGLLDDTFERLDAALDASAAASQALKLGGWAVPQQQRQPLRAAAARGSRGSSIASMAGGGGRVQRHVASLPRPQDSFPAPPDNSDSSPWTPSRFPHLAAKLAAAAAAPGGVSSSSAGVLHPYADELAHLTYQPWQLQQQQGEAEACCDLESAPCTLVDTAEGLAAMVAALQGVTQVAIDLEHHSYRSYQGFTCLLQLSTRQQDWVVDTLALRAQLGPALAALMADPAVEKVLHGSDHDILWLQRDFGLYIINLFDTGQAARVLSYPSASLAYLLERHVGFSADKRYQLADWRLRPLPPDMLAYARADTRFLLGVCDVLKQELRALGDRQPPSWAVQLPPHSGATGALGCVYERSRQLCLQVYSKPTCGPTAALDAALRWNLALPPRNMAVFAALFAWRDRTARALDESVQYVLPKGPLLELARVAPATAAEVRQLLGSGGSGLSGGVSLVVSRAEEVAQVINNALGQQQQQEGGGRGQGAAADSTAAAGSGGAERSPAAVVKPKVLPALVPRKVVPPAVKGAAGRAAAAAGGVRAALGQAAAAAAQPQQQQQPQEQQQQPVQGQQQQQQQQQQQPKSGVSQPTGSSGTGQAAPTAAEQQQQHQQQVPLSAHPAAAVNSNIGSDSQPSAKALALPGRKRSSSLGGVLSNKRPAAAAASGLAESRPVKSFKLDFLTPLTSNNPATAAAAQPPAAAEGPAAAAAAADGRGADGSSGQAGGLQQVTAAEVRAAVDQMLAEQGQLDDEAAQGDDEATAAACEGLHDHNADQGAAAAAAAAAAGAAEGDEDRGAAGFGDLEYVPLSEQHPRKKRTRRPAAAAAAALHGSTDQRQQQGRAGKRADGGTGKRKGLFAGLGGDDGNSSSSDTDSDLGPGGGVMPSYDPNRLAAAATAAAAAAATSAAEEPAAEGRGRSRQQGRGGRGARGGERGQRGSGRRGGHQQQQQQHEGRSLAAVRRRQGGGGSGGSSNLFEVQDGPFKAARRKGGTAGRSKTFKG